jgi:hypothetical protein
LYIKVGNGQYFLYIISVSIILFDILIGPMRYLQKKVEAGDIDGAKEVMSWINFQIY